MNGPFHAKRLCVFVGEGGVGKTSCAAATALTAALGGLHAAVLTIDPAPRLGDALGLPDIDDSPRPVVDGPLATASGTLVAIRLDAKRTFDRLVERYATDPDSARALLENPIYRTLSDSLGGTAAYMAFQRLHELLEDADYDLVVLDTPPAVDAGDLLAAPGRLERLMETGAAKILADPAALLLRAGSRVAAATVGILLAALERAFGAGLRRDVAEFAGGFETVLRALTERSGRIESLLGAPTSSVVQVVRPDLRCVETAESFRRSLAGRGLDVERIVVNRLTPANRRSADTAPEKRLPVEAPAGTAAALRKIRLLMDTLRADEAAACRRLEQGLECAGGEDARPRTAFVDSLGPDLDSLEALRELGSRLYGRAAA